MKDFTLLSIFVGLFAMGISNRIATAAQLPAEGLVAAWAFDETGGDQVKDRSGRGHHGVLRGATRAAGRTGGAIECRTDALVEVPHDKTVDDFKDGITVSAWVNRVADTTWNTVMSREIKAGISEYFGLAVVRNKALFSVDGDGAHYQNLKSDEDVPVGEWVHLAGTYDNKEFILYVNGRLVRSAPYTVPFKFADTNPLLIGGNSNSQGKSWVDCFHGRLDEVRLYNRALSADEVAALASPQPAPSAGSLPTGPLPGDVFREYSWTTEKFHVFSLKTNRFALLAEVDLKDAIRAEVVVELANQHMGFEGMAIRLNGKQWYPIQFPASSPKDPSPSLWFHHWYPTIPIALTDLKEGNENTVELKVPAECFDGRVHPNGKVTQEHPEGEWGWLPPWCPLYGLTVRVYYDPARKPHLTGSVLTPAAQSTLGLSVDLTASAKSDRGAIRQIDFIGRYEDINYEGDGVYRQWHGHLFHGKITHHLGSTTQPEGKATWDTSWVPDQARPMEIAARITDSTGLICMTEAVAGLKLVRPGLSVELCKPFEVPRSFTGCQYGEWVISGVRTQKFTVKGDLSKAIDARYVIASWGNQKECPGYTINGVLLQDKPAGADYYYNLSTPPIRPLTALEAGENTFSTIVAKGRMPDIYMPGVQVLIRYQSGQSNTSQSEVSSFLSPAVLKVRDALQYISAFSKEELARDVAALAPGGLLKADDRNLATFIQDLVQSLSGKELSDGNAAILAGNLEEVLNPGQGSVRQSQGAVRNFAHTLKLGGVDHAQADKVGADLTVLAKVPTDPGPFDGPRHPFRFALSEAPKYDKAVLVEDFENGTDIFKTWYQPYWSTGIVATFDSQHKSGGNRGLTISNTGPTTKRSSMAKFPRPNQDLSGCNALRLWFKPYGLKDSEGTVSMGFIDGSSEIWQVDLPEVLSGIEPCVIQVRLADFRRVLRKNNGRIDLENRDFCFWMTGTYKFTVDDILFVHDPAVPGFPKPSK